MQEALHNCIDTIQDNTVDDSPLSIVHSWARHFWLFSACCVSVAL